MINLFIVIAFFWNYPVHTPEHPEQLRKKDRDLSLEQVLSEHHSPDSGTPRETASASGR
jgi:hypothetical protein